jgi:3-isopropylmalate dehydratase small subunit
MPVNQQFHVEGGIYGLKGKGDFVISQSFTNVKINPAFKPDIVVIDDKKYAEEAKKVRLTGREIKTQSMEQVVSRQKEFSAKNLRKMMKEYEKQDLKEKGKEG